MMGVQIARITSINDNVMSATPMTVLFLSLLCCMRCASRIACTQLSYGFFFLCIDSHMNNIIYMPVDDKRCNNKYHCKSIIKTNKELCIIHILFLPCQNDTLSFYFILYFFFLSVSHFNFSHSISDTLANCTIHIACMHFFFHLIWFIILNCTFLFVEKKKTKQQKQQK